MGGSIRVAIATAVAAAVLTNAPAIADSFARFARNSDKVDGIHAVRAHAKKRERRLIATDRRGKLPNFIVSKVSHANRARQARHALSASRLGRHSPEDFRFSCEGNAGWAQLSPTLPAVWSSLTRNVYNCTDGSVAARHPETGVYRVWFDHLAPQHACDVTNFSPGPLVAMASVSKEVPLSVQYVPVDDQPSRSCGGDIGDNFTTGIEITIRNDQGQLVDATVTFVLLNRA